MQKAKPNVVKIYEGNPGHQARRSLNLSDGVNPLVAIPTAPKWLRRHARIEWDRIGAELADLGLIAKIDLAALAIYCQAWSDLSDAEEAFNDKIKASRAAGEKGFVGAILHKTPTGYLRDDPLYRVVTELRKSVDVFMRNFGLNPSARMRVQASNYIQANLPGFEPEAAPASVFAELAAQGRRAREGSSAGDVAGA